MFPLLLGISFDFYLIARLILNNATMSLAMSAALLMVFAVLWFLLPRVRRLQKIALWKS
jgi:hypothetical protein